jgi:hypothetical protein
MANGRIAVGLPFVKKESVRTRTISAVAMDERFARHSETLELTPTPTH